MSKSDAKALAIIGGVCAIIGAATTAEQSREWKDIHKIVAVVGFGAAILGMFA